MQNYLESFAQPTVGHKQNLENGHEILVSARLLTQGHPYNIITDLALGEFDKPIRATDNGTLLFDARDPAHAEDGSIAHCVLLINQGRIDIVDMAVAYPYRGNQIMEALIALAGQLTELPLTDLPKGPFKYM